ETTARRRLDLNRGQLRDAAETIIIIGSLQRSRIYGNLLRYRAHRTISDQHPKDTEIYIQDLGRTTTFDVSRSSAIRVQLHQLRKRLEQYYETHAPQAPWRLTIPKGQYTLEVLATEPSEAAAAASESPAAEAEGAGDPSTVTEQNRDLLPLPLQTLQLRPHRKWPYLLILLLACNLATLLFLLAQGEDKPAAAE